MKMNKQDKARYATAVFSSTINIALELCMLAAVRIDSKV